MQVGIITLGDQRVGIVTLNYHAGDGFMPDLGGYEPMGRASESPQGTGGALSPSQRQGGGGASKGRHGPRHGQGGPSRESHGHGQPHVGQPNVGAPKGEHYAPSTGHPFEQGSAQTDQAIVEASQAHGLDPNTMRGIASIESGMNPSSNAQRATQYKGLYQVGHEEWRRFGQGNIYSAKDNANATARMFEANRSQFKAHFGRDPTDTELYLMHQQGLGFYTRGAMTNISGNPYPGMHGPQSHESFEVGWGRELARRKAGFEKAHPAPSAEAKPTKPFDPGTDAL
jgi:hypothetical protein